MPILHTEIRAALNTLNSYATLLIKKKKKWSDYIVNCSLMWEDTEMLLHLMKNNYLCVETP